MLVQVRRRPRVGWVLHSASFGVYLIEKSESINAMVAMGHTDPPDGTATKSSSIHFS